MPKQTHDHALLSRRDFIFAAIMSPFLVNALIADNRIGAERSMSANSQDEFVILDGWVLLKTDLV